MSEENNKQNSISSMIPSELRLNQKWDFAIENFITRPALGFAVAGLASIVLFRKYFSSMFLYFGASGVLHFFTFWFVKK